MKSWFIESYGPPARSLGFRGVPPSPPGPGEVAVLVEAAALNPVDLKAVLGESRMILPMKPPFVVGVDFAGVVEAVGEGVRALAIGDAVIAYTGMARMGAFAERVIVPATMLGRPPAGWSMVESATLPLPGLCARQALDAAVVQAGQSVLIHGGAGGVGSLAVRIAAARGARVTATVGPRDLDRVRALGAAVAIDYTSQRFEELAHDQDVVFDTVGGGALARSFSAVKRGGVVVSLHGAPSLEAMHAAGLRPPWFLGVLLPLVGWGTSRRVSAAGARFLPQVTVPDGASLSEVARLDLPRPVIDRTFPFTGLPAAFARLTSGEARGRVCLDRSHA